MPVVAGSTVAVHLTVFASALINALVQEKTVRVVVAPSVMKDDVPAVEAVPAEILSLTNTVHVTCWPTATEAGEHVTTVVVARKPTVTVLLTGLGLVL